MLLKLMNSDYLNTLTDDRVLICSEDEDEADYIVSLAECDSITSMEIPEGNIHLVIDELNKMRDDIITESSWMDAIAGKSIRSLSLCYITTYDYRRLPVIILIDVPHHYKTYLVKPTIIDKVKKLLELQ